MPPTDLTREPSWDIIIRPRREWWDLRLRELWHSRELIMLFVHRDFVSGYKQTILGPLWYVLQPLLTTLTFMVVFSRIAGLSTNGVPAFLFYLSGTVMWNYFASCLLRTSNVFVGNAALFGKVYFSRLASPASALVSNLVSFSTQFLLLVVGVLIYWTVGAPIRPNAGVLLLPVLLFIAAGLGVGLGLVISSLTTKYRDLQNLVGFGVQLLMYATPVIYPLSAVPRPFRLFVSMNPLTSALEAFRGAFLGAGVIDPGGLLYSTLATCAVLLIGLILFNKAEQNSMDTV